MQTNTRIHASVFLILSLIYWTSPAIRADHMSLPSGNLLYDIQNPFVNIPRVQIENLYDSGEGRLDATTNRLRMRPITPFTLTEDVGLRVRTTLNMTYQSALTSKSPNQIGFGDTDFEFWFTNNKSLAHDALIIGVGPSIHIPTSTQTQIGYRQWGAGGTAAVIWQPATIYALRGWTFALSANQSFGFAPDNHVRPLQILSVNPSVSYTFESEVAVNAYSESVYNWTYDQWTIPINLSLSTLVKPFGQNIVITTGGRYYVASGTLQPTWGTTLNFNFLFPED